MGESMISPSNKAAIREQREKRDRWKCLCRPICASREAHEIAIGARRKAAHHEPKTIIERLAKFSVDPVTDQGVLEMVTHSELYVVSENGVPMHFVAYPADPYESQPRCVLHGPHCEAEIACVAWRLKHSMETDK